METLELGFGFQIRNQISSELNIGLIRLKNQQKIRDGDRTGCSGLKEKRFQQILEKNSWTSSSRKKKNNQLSVL